MASELTAWQLADIFKRQLVQREAQMTQRLVAAYSRIQAGLKDKIDLLEAEAQTRETKLWKVQQLERWRTTKAAIEQQMAVYDGIVQNEMQADLAQSVKMGLIEAQQLTLGVVPAEMRPYIQNAWNLMDPAAVENALVQAAALGLGTCWVGIRDGKGGPGPERQRLVREVLDIPQHVSVLALVSLGHPAGETHPKPAGPMDAVHYESW